MIFNLNFNNYFTHFNEIHLNLYNIFKYLFDLYDI